MLALGMKLTLEYKKKKKNNPRKKVLATAS